MKKFLCIVILFLIPGFLKADEESEYFIKVSCVPEIKYFGVEVIDGNLINELRFKKSILWKKYRIIDPYLHRKYKYECKILDKPFVVKIFTSANSNGAFRATILIRHEGRVLFDYFRLFSESQREIITEIEKVEFSINYWRYKGFIVSDGKYERFVKRFYFDEECKKFFPVISDDYYYEQLDKIEEQKIKEEKENKCILYR